MHCTSIPQTWPLTEGQNDTVVNFGKSVTFLYILSLIYRTMMNVKPRLNHERYIGILQQMTPEERLSKALELSEFGRALFVHGLRKRFPLLSAEEFNKKLRERLDKCHNRNY